ncbi:hypothetical protein KMS_R50420 [Pseudomonas sp. LRP2-20]|uniref:hypothetical protein n=1 Tax=Pseudomonas sp. LRP2-20 TaxID=2944234 RepID=UPI002188D227|nr:hypothetical protein [Pseudomonas sp. LRP2-20]BDM25285.1 hypothetical protein KMS_R50420 [Pseudomonas sp. LRP2-20]
MLCLGWAFTFCFSAQANDLELQVPQGTIGEKVWPALVFVDRGIKSQPGDFVYGLDNAVSTVLPNSNYKLDSNVSESGFFGFGISAQDFLIWVPLIALIVTNFVSIRNLRETSKAAIKKELAVDSFKIFKAQLSEFYDPLNALVSANYDMFEALGPKTFPSDPYKGEEAADLWNEVVSEVILPNNQAIVDIIKTKTHLIDSTDSLNHYFYYVKHAQSYMLFRKQSNSLHEKFPYPKDFLGHIGSVRAAVLKKLVSKEKELSA